MDNSMCRTCMKYNAEVTFTQTDLDKEESRGVKMISIYNVPEEIKDQNLCLKELLKASIPQLKFEDNDKLPKILCSSCSDKIIHFYNFHLMCLRNEEKLYKILELGEESETFLNSTENHLDDAPTKSEVIKCLNQNGLIDYIEEEKEIENLYCSEDDSNKSDVLSPKIINDSNCSLVTKNKKNKDKKTTRSVKKKLKQTPSKCSSRSAKRNSKELYSCDKCQRKLKSELSLMKHQELHLKRDIEEKELKCSACDQGDNINLCPYCGSPFCNSLAVLNKIKPIHSEGLRVPNLVLSGEPQQKIAILKEHQRTHTCEKTFLCSECGKGFASAGSLKQHSFRHLEKKLFPCPDCPKSFPTKGDLIGHFETHKAKPRIHVCDICGRGFYKPFLLKQHQRYHNDERPFPCEFCEKRFVTSEKQRRHMRTHTGEKPYPCKYCDRAFAQSGDCIKHLRQHIGDNVYQCELCPLRFPLVKHLRAHFATHKDDDEETRSRNLKARKEEERNMQIKFGNQEL